MKIRIQKTWYGWKAWDPHEQVAPWDSPPCVRVIGWFESELNRAAVIEKARKKFGPKPPKWEELDV